MMLKPVLIASLLLTLFACERSHHKRETQPNIPTNPAPDPDDTLSKQTPYEVALDAKGFRIDGKYRLLRGGSVQWFRLPESTWEDRLRKYKNMGFNALDIYIAWNQVEPEEGRFQFDKPNLARFLELAQSFGLYVVVRPGPYITNEMDGGGMPAWLTRKATKKSYEADGRPNLRTADPDFIQPVDRYLTALNKVLKPYMADQGGPVVLYVIENEYTWFERSFNLDHLFTYDGGLERPLDQPMRTAEYFTALRDIVRKSGVTIPLVTCPGDGKISAIGDVPDVIPFPNIYEWANPGQPEEIAYDLLTEMHDPSKRGGIYQNSSSGSMELNRNTQESRRLLMGGLDAIFTFNLAGMIQQGYMNSLTMGARAGDVAPHWGEEGEQAQDWVGTIFDLSDPKFYVNGFVAPLAGYFGNVIDYDGPLSASGVTRDLYYQYRRDNFFFNTVETILGAAERPIRSGTFDGADPRLTVANDRVGVRQELGRLHYWHEVGGTSFISLVNQSGAVQTVAKGGITFKDEKLPRFTELTVPLAEEKKTSYAMLLLHDFPLKDDFRLHFASSELMTLQPFNGESLLVMHGTRGSAGELTLSAPGISLVAQDSGIKVEETTADSLTVSYQHGAGQVALFQNASGKRLRVYLTTTEDAGRLWFFEQNKKSLMISGLDDLETLSNGALRLTRDARATTFDLLSSDAVNLKGLETGTAYNPATGLTRLVAPAMGTQPVLPVLTQALIFKDQNEIAPAFDDSSWKSIQGEPQPLETLDIYQGHTWYRTQVTIEAGADLKKYDQLYIDSASDLVGIYVNGHYLGTMNPFGTEIDNQSRNAHYQFPALSPYLQHGVNTLVFRTEVWGHGSFMFGRGTVIGTTARMPALPYDGLKGLYGKARLGDKDLTAWKVGTQLGGERLGYADPAYNTKDWQTVSGTSLALEKGGIVWYRAQFLTSQLPAPAQWAAPVGLELKGRSAKATIFLNGQMIGRWLSDEDWLQKGFWGRPQRGMWVPLSPDQFPMPYEMLRQDGKPNQLAIAFEDCSSAEDAAGLLESIRLAYNEEGMIWKDNAVQRTAGIKSVFNVSF